MADSARILELKAALDARMQEGERIASTFQIERGPGAPGGAGVVVSPDQAAAYRKCLSDAKEIKGLIELEGGMQEIKAWMGQPAGQALGPGAAAAGAGSSADLGLWTPGGSGVKSIGQMFTDSVQFKDFKSAGGSQGGYMQSPWEAEGMDFANPFKAERKDIYTTVPGGPSLAPRFGQIQFDPLVPLQQRRVRVRDLFPAQATSANMIEFFRVTGFTNNASVIPERSGGAFAMKPQSTLNFEATFSPVQIIAHWEVVHRNVINDEPQIQGLINNELLYGLRLQEDYQILQGTGTSSDLLGILNTPGIQGYTHSSAQVPPANIVDNKADDIRRAATRIILAYYEPTGLIVHPFDWEAIELTKDQYGRYLVVTGGVAVGAEKTLWQMPVVDTPAIPEGKFLTGAFGLGAQLYDREVGNIRIAEQHADLFLRNAVAVLAEERIALAVKRPESFCLGTF